jgi:chromosome segregation ATPase
VAVPRPAPASEVQKLNKEIETLLRRIAVLTQTNGKNDRELAQAKTKITELETGLAQAKTKITELENQVGDRDTRISNLQPELSASTADNADLRGQLAASTAENSDLRGHLAASNARVAELETGLAQRDARIAELETGLAQANAAGAAAAAPIAAVVINMDTQDLMDQNTSLQNINSDLRGQLGAQKMRVNALNIQFRNAKRKLEELEKPADEDDGIQYVGTTYIQNTTITEDLENNGGAAGAP